MKKYRTKEIVEAKRWFDISDFPEANMDLYDGNNKKQICVICNSELGKHGKMLFPDNSYDLICPGDWLIRYSNSKIYPCDNETFTKVYEEVD